MACPSCGAENREELRGFGRVGSGQASRVNRFLRRMQRFGKSWSGRRSQDEMTKTPRDVPDVRAKSTGHGKKTADKWNQ